MSKTSNANLLEIESIPFGKTGLAIVKVLQGGEILAFERLNLAKSKARQQFVKSLVDKNSELDGAAVEKELLRMVAEPTAETDMSTEIPVELDSQELLLKMPKDVRDEAQKMLETPGLLDRVVDDVAACGVAGERDLLAQLYLIGVSRLLPQPLAGIVQSQSSTGKSYTVEKTAKLFPPETVIHATAISPKALVYMKPGTLSHKFVVAGERSRRHDDESADSTKMLREMLSGGRISQLVTIKENGHMATKRIEQDGPIAYVETTTAGRIFNEDANRCLLLTTDERPEQTEKIIKQSAIRYAGKVSVNNEPTIQKHYAMQRMLAARPVIIPFAEDVAATIKTTRVEARRAFPHLMNMIQASALLHQFQRQSDAENRIVATQSDYDLALRVCKVSLARLIEGRVSDPALRFYERLKLWPISKVFTVSDVAKLERGVTRETIRGWLWELEGDGKVELTQLFAGSKGNQWTLVVQGCANSPPNCHDLAQNSCKDGPNALCKVQATRNSYDSENSSNGVAVPSVHWLDDDLVY